MRPFVMVELVGVYRAISMSSISFLSMSLTRSARSTPLASALAVR